MYIHIIHIHFYGAVKLEAIAIFLSPAPLSKTRERRRIVHALIVQAPFLPLSPSLLLPRDGFAMCGNAFSIFFLALFLSLSLSLFLSLPAKHYTCILTRQCALYVYIIRAEQKWGKGQSNGVLFTYLSQVSSSDRERERARERQYLFLLTVCMYTCIYRYYTVICAFYSAV